MGRQLYAFLATFLAIAASLAEDSKQSTAEDLLARASRAGSLEAAAKGPCRIRYKFKVMTSPEIEGTYSRLWASADRSREEISTPDFSETVIINGGKMWTSRNLPYEPEVFTRLRSALDPSFKILHGENVQKSKKKQGKEHSTCIDLSVKNGTQRQLCFDEQTNALVATSSGTFRSEYSEFKRIEPSLIPHAVRMFNGGQLEGSVEAIELAPQPSLGDSSFARPPDAEEWTFCERPTPPKLVHTQSPEYPALATAARWQGSVDLYGVLETDGTLKHTGIIRSAKPVFEKAALDAVKEWRWEPGTCNGVPIRLETQITINFSLSGNQ